MAVMWSLIPIKNTVLLEYGPAGTTHFGAGLYSSFGISLENSLFTTHISEDDVIMGDVTRLEKSIVEIDENYHPDVIFVVASAVVAVIGTDIKGVCQYMQEKVKAKLICFDDGGFGGDYTIGLQNTYTLLTKQFALHKEVSTNKHTYNILGASAASYRIRSDVWEIQNMMKSAFNMTHHAVLGLECTIEQLEHMGTAAINIVLRKEAIPAAKLLEETYGTPYVYQAPYGYKATLEWLQKIANLTSQTIETSFQTKLEKKMNDAKQIQQIIQMTRIHPIASIIGDYDNILGFQDFFEEFGFEIDQKICSHPLKTSDADDQEMSYYKVEKEKIDTLKSVQRQLVFGDDVSLNMCDNSNRKVCTGFPFLGRTQVATHLPFMGEKGTDYLVEVIREYFSSIR